MNTEIEILKDVKDYEGIYKVSNLGEVFSIKSNKKLKKHINTSGYPFVNLYKNKKGKTTTIHQIMAIAFLNHKPCKFERVVDHIDNNKLNNRLDNLQIISNRYNSYKDKNSSSGHFNIYKNHLKWLVRMRINGVKKSFGTFVDINDAIKRRDFILKELNKRI
jgi:hypothetical protein